MEEYKSKINSPLMDPNSEEVKKAMEGLSYTQACSYIEKKLKMCDADHEALWQRMQEISLVMDKYDERITEWLALTFKLAPASLIDTMQAVEGHEIPTEWKGKKVIRLD